MNSKYLMKDIGDELVLGTLRFPTLKISGGKVLIRFMRSNTDNVVIKVVEQPEGNWTIFRNGNVIDIKNENDGNMIISSSTDPIVGCLEISIPDSTEIIKLTGSLITEVAENFERIKAKLVGQVLFYTENKVEQVFVEIVGQGKVEVVKSSVVGAVITGQGLLEIKECIASIVKMVGQSKANFEGPIDELTLTMVGQCKAELDCIIKDFDGSMENESELYHEEGQDLSKFKVIEKL